MYCIGTEYALRCHGRAARIEDNTKVFASSLLHIGTRIYSIVELPNNVTISEVAGT